MTDFQVKQILPLVRRTDLVYGLLLLLAAAFILLIFVVPALRS